MTLLAKTKPTAPHILRGEPALIPREGRSAAVKDMGLPEFESLTEEDLAEIRRNNAEGRDAHRKQGEALKANLARLIDDPETIGPDAIFGVQDVWRQQFLDWSQAGVRVHRADLALLVDGIIPSIEATYRKRDADIQKTFDKVARKLNNAGISVETTLAGRTGANPDAAQNQFNFQVRQHADYQQAIALRDQAQNDLLRAKHVARVKSETIDYAVEQLQATVCQMLAGVSLDF
jgi:hypothetical protein